MKGPRINADDGSTGAAPQYAEMAESRNCIWPITGYDFFGRAFLAGMKSKYVTRPQAG
jgi:hypothetical protein